MPTLKQVTCSIEIGPSNTKLKEYHHRYTDGGVEAFIAVPEADIPFRIHITSNGYIAPGLAAWIFIDGQYQCNRNRQRLQTPCPGMNPREYEIDFMLRQREEKTSDGSFVARDWAFSKLHTDMAPNVNPNFAKNVGTIEVVLLRCKNGGDEPSAEDLTDSAGAPAGTAKPASVLREPPRPADRAPSKAPSKAASKVSTKKASDVGSVGGLFGLFDGAGDHPGYGSYTPRYPREPHPSPGYRAYRDDRYEPRPYTLHGGRNHGGPPRHEMDDMYDPRPRTSAGLYPPGSPMGGYDFQQRRRVDPPYPQPQPIDRMVYPPYPQQQPRLAQRSTPEGFHFIQEICQQLDELMRVQFEETRRYDQLQNEAHMNRHDAEVHLAAVKATREKERTLATLIEEGNALWSSIITRMNRMDEDAWNFVRDYVVLERRLVPMSHPQFQRWRDPRLPPSTATPVMQSPHPSAGQGSGWQEEGEGQAQGGLWERKQQDHRRAHQNPQQQIGGQWPTSSPDAIDQPDNNDHWIQRNDQNQGGNAWGHQSQGGKSNNGNNWDNGGKSNNSASNNSGGGWGGGNQNDNTGGDAWPQNNDSRHSQSNRAQDQNNDASWGGNDNGGGGGGDDWDNGGGDPAKSRTAQSKVAGWDSGNNSGGGDNWGNEKQQSQGGGGGGWGAQGDNKSRSASNHASRHSHRPRKGDASTILEPIIKPYWAEWDKPDDSSRKLRTKPREPYEYPALPPPVAASGKASSVNYGVQAGRGANYQHQSFRPEYLDSMEKPYAIITFKYRSKNALEKILKRKIDVGDVQRAIQEAEKDNLMKMPKDELVSNMMKLKLKGGGGGGANPPSKPASKAAPGNGCGNQTASTVPSKKNDRGGGGGWGDGADDEVKPNESASQWGGNNDNNEAQSGWDNINDQGGGGGGNAWGGGADRKSNRGGGDAWGNNDAGGGNADGWANGNGDQDKNTEEHFAGDAGLKQTGGDQKPSGSWAAAGW